MKNQCMGCQAGWPIDTKHGDSLVIHSVKGGYPHEIVSCTADRYNKCGSLIASVSSDPCENPAKPGELCIYCAEFKALCELHDATL